jgi:hypothetical protein
MRGEGAILAVIISGNWGIYSIGEVFGIYLLPVFERSATTTIARRRSKRNGADGNARGKEWNTKLMNVQRSCKVGIGS